MHDVRRVAIVASVVTAVLCVDDGRAAEKVKDPMNVVDGVLDEIHLKVATLAAGAPVVLRPFSTEGADLGTGGAEAKKATRSDAAQAIVKNGPGMLAEALKSTLSESRAFPQILEAQDGPVPENALVVEGRFLKIDPGSKAKRYWASFGAGASGVQVSGVVKDASGNLLAEFTHMKHSGIGMGGGDYLKFLSDDTRDVGRDIGRFLATWAAGGDLHKD